MPKVSYHQPAGLSLCFRQDFLAVASRTFRLVRSGQPANVKEIMYRRFLGYGEDIAKHMTSTPSILDWFLRRFKREGYQVDPTTYQVISTPVAYTKAAFDFPTKPTVPVDGQ
jgi:hypothetical protein